MADLRKWIKPLQVRIILFLVNSKKIVNDPNIKPLEEIEFFSSMHKDLIQAQDRKRRRQTEELENDSNGEHVDIVSLSDEEISNQTKEDTLSSGSKRGNYGKYSFATQSDVLVYAKKNGVMKAVKRFAAYDNGIGIPERTSNKFSFQFLNFSTQLA